MQTREEDVVQHLFVANTHAYILIFTDRGKCYWLRVYDVPEVSRSSKGKSIANLVNMAEGEKMAALLRVQEFPEEEGKRFIVMGTQEGHDQEDRPRRRSRTRASAGIIAIQIDDDDRLIAVAETDGTKDLVIGSRNGMAIRFAEADARPMGRTAYGVRGMQLREGDEVVAMEVVERRRHAAHGLRERLRQAHRRQRVPAPDARRHRPQERPDQRPQRPRRRHRLRHRSRRTAARHRAGPDHPHEGRRPAADRPRHAGRAADGSGRRRSARVDRDADASRTMTGARRAGRGQQSPTTAQNPSRDARSEPAS